MKYRRLKRLRQPAIVVKSYGSHSAATLIEVGRLSTQHDHSQNARQASVYQSNKLGDPHRGYFRIQRLIVKTLLIWLWFGAVMPAFGNPLQHDWCRFEFGSWEIITDIPSAQIPPLVATMQQAASVFSRLHASDVDLRGRPLQIWAFERRRDFRRALGEAHFSGFAQPSLNRIRLLFGPSQGQPGVASLQQNARHEFTHFLQRSTLARQLPAWLEEGQAGVIGSMQWDADAAVVKLPSQPGLEGEVSRRELQRFTNARDFQQWPLERLQQFYRFGQLLVQAQLQHQMLTARQQPGVSAADASALPMLPAGFWANDAVALLRRHRGSLRRGVRALSFQVPATVNANLQITGQDCGPGTNLRLALAQAIASMAPDRAQQLLEAIPPLARPQPQWFIVRSQVEAALGQEQNSLLYAERAVAQAPDAGAAQIRLADALLSQCWVNLAADCATRWRRAERLYRQGLKQLPDRVDAIYGLGLARLHSGQAGDGLNYLRVAQQRAPWSAQVNFYLGESYRLLGNPLAERHLRNAVAWAAHPFWRKRAQAALELWMATGTAQAPADSDG